MSKTPKRSKQYLTKSSFCIEPQEIFFEQDSKTLSGLRILHISDLHIDKNTSIEELEYLVQVINAQNVDFVALTGDIIDTKVASIKQKLEVLKNISKTTYFISGNHDLVYGYEALKQIFLNTNIVCMDNAYEVLYFNENPYLLWGLSDRFSKFFKIKRDTQELVQRVQNYKLPNICLAHQPKDYTYALQSEATLFLCGHTHGGQIAPFQYFVRLFQPFIHGLHKVKNTAIYVNSGLGSWGIKYRFLTQAEITVIQLQ